MGEVLVPAGWKMDAWLDLEQGWSTARGRWRVQERDICCFYGYEQEALEEDAQVGAFELNRAVTVGKVSRHLFALVFEFSRVGQVALELTGVV